MLAALFSQLYMCFDHQLHMIGRKIFEEFDISIRKMSKRDAINDTFMEQTTKVLDSCMRKFKTMSAELIIENSGWENQVTSNNNELQSQLETVIKNARDREMEKMNTIT